MASVFAVQHITLKTRHALKVLDIADVSIRRRLVREGRVQASLQHANAVAVTDVFEHEGAPVLLMEFVDGPDLGEVLHRHTIDELDVALGIFGGILAGLRSAHRLGIVHRDLKPGNVLLKLAPGVIRPKVADFGLARTPDPGSMKRTAAGTTMGTPAFMAPEQIRDASSVDQRADVFSLGCILYQLVTGVQCFDGDDLFAVFRKIGDGDYVAPEVLRPDLPDAIVQAIRASLQVDREDRIQSCDAFAEQVFGCVEGFETTVSIESVVGTHVAALWAEQLLEYERRRTIEPLQEDDVVGTASSLSSPATATWVGDDEANSLAVSTPVPMRAGEPRQRGALAWFLAAGTGVIGLVAVLGLVGLAAVSGTLGDGVPVVGPLVDVDATQPMELDEVVPDSLPAEAEGSSGEPVPVPDVIVAPEPSPIVEPRPVVVPISVAPVPAAPVPAAPALVVPEVVGAAVDVVINSAPWSRVSIDGRDVGNTDWTGTLAPGSHTVVLNRSDGTSKMMVLSVVAGNPLRYCWDFTLEAPCPD